MTLKRIIGIATYMCVLVAAGVLVVTFFKAGLTIADIKFLRPLIVLSGSMEPNYKVGSVALMRLLDHGEIEKIAIGDVITFRSPESSERLVTHRVVAIKGRGDSLQFTTKGDANEEPDSWEVTPGLIVGQAKFSIPYLGYAMSFAGTKKGYLTLILIPALLLVFGEIKNIIGCIRDSEDRQNRSDRPRRRRYKGRHAIVNTNSSKATLKIFTALFLAGALLLLSNTGKITLASFFDIETTQNCEFSAALFDDAIKLTPGKALTLRQSGCGEPATHKVATEEAEPIYLDIGEIKKGFSDCFPDVFRLENIFGRDLLVVVDAEGEISPLISKLVFQSTGISGSHILNKGERVSVNIKTEVGCDQKAGTYRGFITIKALKGFLYERIPVAIEVCESEMNRDSGEIPEAQAEPLDLQESSFSESINNLGAGQNNEEQSDLAPTKLDDSAAMDEGITEGDSSRNELDGSNQTDMGEATSLIESGDIEGKIDKSRSTILVPASEETSSF